MTIAVKKAYDLDHGVWNEDEDGTLARAAVANMSAIEDEMSPAEVDEILMQRATRLAEVLVEKDDEEQIDLLLVRLGREVYGLEAQYVARIEPVDVGCITRVPRVPEWVAGVTNLRGRILSAIDLRRFLGLPSADQGRMGSCLVAVDTPEIGLALIVDDVVTVEALADSRVREATSTVRGLRPEYVRGVAERLAPGPMPGGEPSSMVVVLDLPAMLADEKLVVHEEIF